MRTGFKRFQAKEILEAVGRMVEYKKMKVLLNWTVEVHNN